MKEGGFVLFGMVAFARKYGDCALQPQVVQGWVCVHTCTVGSVRHSVSHVHPDSTHATYLAVFVFTCIMHHAIQQRSKRTMHCRTIVVVRIYRAGVQRGVS